MAEWNLGNERNRAPYYNPRRYNYTPSYVAFPPLEKEVYKQRDLCRVKKTNGKYGGYKKYILTEVKERDNALLICEVCKGIMREACFDTSSGEQFCSCCDATKQPYTSNMMYSFAIRTTPNVPVRNTINLLKCSWLGILEECENHLDTCGYVGDKCKVGCEEVLHRKELNAHKDSCPYRNVQCKHCTKVFNFRDMPKHLKECSKMKVSCKLKCGIVMRREDVTQHLKKDCGMMVETCTLECGMRMTRDELKIHVINTCVQREVPCEHCWEYSKFCDIPNHLKKCPKMEVSCELNCGIVVCREDIAQHLAEDCIEKEIECPFVKYKCEVTSIKRKYLSQHLEETETKHLRLKLNAMEDILFKQCEGSNEIKQYVDECKQHRNESKKYRDESKQHRDESKQHRDQSKQHRGESKQYRDESKQDMEEINRHKRYMDNQMVGINRMAEHITALCSISRTTMLDWKIENLSEFTRNNHAPEECIVKGYNINIYFLKEIISVDTGNCASFTAKFLIRLYSTIKCRVVKEYNYGTASINTREYGKQRIVHITKSDAEELSRTGSANKLILEMYLTIQ